MCDEQNPAVSVTSALSYAFALGLLAAINPCGFPMLPGYLSFFVGERAGEGAGTSARLYAAVRSSVAVSGGFVAVFAVLGAAFEAGISVFMNWVPWVMLAVALTMGALGVAGLAGRKVALRLALPARGGRSATMRSMAGYGVSYAVASLTCSLSLFLAGVGSSFTRSGIATGVATFVAYAAGMAAVLTVVSVSVALARTSILGVLRRSGRYLERAGSVLLVAVSLYLVDYWVSYLVDPTASWGPLAVMQRLQSTLTGLLDRGGVELLVGLAAAAVAVVALGFHLGSLSRDGAPREPAEQAAGLQGETREPVEVR